MLTWWWVTLASRKGNIFFLKFPFSCFILFFKFAVFLSWCLSIPFRLELRAGIELSCGSVVPSRTRKQYDRYLTDFDVLKILSVFQIASFFVSLTPNAVRRATPLSLCIITKVLQCYALHFANYAIRVEPHTRIIIESWVSSRCLGLLSTKDTKVTKVTKPKQLNPGSKIKIKFPLVPRLHYLRLTTGSKDLLLFFFSIFTNLNFIKLENFLPELKKLSF